VEDIPYAETRGYVKRVLGSYERYRTLYAPKQAESQAPRAEKKRAGGR
jgi:soluble lytic murein transglycosylase-like protein